MGNQAILFSLGSTLLYFNPRSFQAQNCAQPFSNAMVHLDLPTHRLIVTLLTAWLWTTQLSSCTPSVDHEVTRTKPFPDVNWVSEREQTNSEKVPLGVQLTRHSRRGLVDEEQFGEWARLHVEMLKNKYGPSSQRLHRRASGSNYLVNRNPYILNQISS